MKNDQLKTLVEENPRVTLRELAEEVCVSIETIPEHLNQIEKSKNSTSGCHMNETKIKRIDVMKSVLHFFFETKTSRFLIVL